MPSNAWRAANQAFRSESAKLADSLDLVRTHGQSALLPPKKPKRGRVQVSNRLLFINSGSSVLAKLLSISVLFWLQQYFLRNISSEEYALIPVVMSVMAVVPLLTLALTAGIGRFVTAAYDEGDEGRITQIVSTLVPILSGAALLILGLGATIVAFADSLLTVPPDLADDVRWMLGMFFVAAAIRLPLAPYGVGFQVTQRFVLYNLIDVGTELLRIGLLVALVLGISPRVIWTVVAEVSTEFLMLVVTRWMSKRMLPALRFERSAIRWEMARELTSFGAWKLVIRTAQTIRQSLDPIVLNKLSSAHELACFHLGTMVIRQLQTIGNNAMQASLPQLTARWVRGDIDGLRQSFLRGNRYAMWLTIGIGSPLFVFARPIIHLYAGEKFSLAADVMMLSMASIPFRYANSMTARLAHATAELRPFGLRLIVAQTINLVLTIFFVGTLQMGAVGSITATLIASLVGLFLSMPLGIRYAQTTISEWLRESVWRGGLPGLIAIPILVMIRSLVEPERWRELAAATIVVVPVYLVSVWWVADASERSDARAGVQAVLRKVKRVAGMGSADQPRD